MIHFNGYGIDSDGKCYTVGKYSKRLDKKTGKMVDYIKDPRYYTRVSTMLDGLMEAMMRDKVESSEITTLQELVQALQSIQHAINETLYPTIIMTKGENE